MDGLDKKITAVVLISGSGSNLQSIIDATQSKQLNIEIATIISNRPDVKGLQRGIDAGIHCQCLDHKAFSSREAFDRALQEHIDQHQPQLVILAGFMRILTAEFVRHYRGRLLNIHPSLLPKHAGLHTHQRAIDAGDKLHGASIHFVTEELDGGPVILQGEVDIFDNDNAEQLANRVLEIEHRIYPQAIQWFAEGRLQLLGNQLLFDKNPLTQPIVIS